MSTLLMNKSVEQVLTLPYPYAGTVAPGRMAILREDTAVVAAMFGPNLADKPISLTALPPNEVKESDYAQYDPVVKLTHADSGYVLKPWQRIVSADTRDGTIAVYAPTVADITGYSSGHYSIQILDALGNFGTNALTLYGNGPSLNGASSVVFNANHQSATYTWVASGYDLTASATGTVTPTASSTYTWTPRIASAVNLATLTGPRTLDGVAAVAGDLVFLLGQTDAKENGPWLVAAGAWTRPTTLVAPGQYVFPLLGTSWAGTTLQIQGQGALTYGTDNIVILQINNSALVGPLSKRAGTATLVAGVVTISNVTLTSASTIQITRRTPLGTAIGSLSAPAADRTTGVLVGSFIIRAFKADATAETSDVSTVDWTILS
jgi:hypothetical protein